MCCRLSTAHCPTPYSSTTCTHTQSVDDMHNIYKDFQFTTLLLVLYAPSYQTALSCVGTLQLRTTRHNLLIDHKCCNGLPTTLACGVPCAQAEEESQKLFEWQDGVLVQAMSVGAGLLVDEISLAEDAVLERLNSVLEPERKVLVAERGSELGGAYEVVAKEGFVLFATMNPGGDYGKREVCLCVSVCACACVHACVSLCWCCSFL